MRCTGRGWPASAPVGYSRTWARAAGKLRCDDTGVARWLMHLDQVDYLPDDVLFKTDRAGMLASLEIRTVFLNRELADFAASLDTSVHLAGGGKALLRAMLPTGVLETPRPGRYRKTAFRVPAAEWLRARSRRSCSTQPEHGILYSEG